MSLADLGVKAEGVEVEATRDRFEAKMTAPKSAGGKRWTIREDGRITSE